MLEFSVRETVLSHFQRATRLSVSEIHQKCCQRHSSFSSLSRASESFISVAARGDSARGGGGGGRDSLFSVWRARNKQNSIKSAVAGAQKMKKDIENKARARAFYQTYTAWSEREMRKHISPPVFCN